MQNTSKYGLPQFVDTDVFNKEDINKAFLDIDTAIGDMQDTISTVSGGSGPIIQEVITSHGAYGSLPLRLDGVDASLEDIAYDISKHGLKLDGTNETALFQALVDNPKVKSIIIPKDTTLTIDTVGITKDNFTIYNYGAIKINYTLWFSGVNSGIIGGLILGNLKIAQLSQDTPIGSTVLNLTVNPFVIGDKINIVSILGDADNGIFATIIDVSGLTITTDMPTINHISQANSYVGNYSNWGATLQFHGDNFLKLCEINYARGYAYRVKPLAILHTDRITVTKNGLDLVCVEGKLFDTYSTMGFSYADSKQGYALAGEGQGIELYLNGTSFNSNNWDADIMTWGVNYIKMISLKNTKHNKSYDSNICFRPNNVTNKPLIPSGCVINFNNHETTPAYIDYVEIENMTANGYKQILECWLSSATSRYILKTIKITNLKTENSGLWLLGNFKFDRFVLDNSEIKNCIETVVNANNFVTSPDWNDNLGNPLLPIEGNIEINNTVFDNIIVAKVIMYNVTMNNCILGNVRRIRAKKLRLKNCDVLLQYTGGGLALIEELVVGGLIFEDCSFNLSALNYDGMNNALYLKQPLINFKMINGNGWGGIILVSGTSAVIVYDVKTIDGSVPTNLCSSQYYIPTASVFRNMTGVVVKTISYGARKNTGAIGILGQNTLTLNASVTMNMAVGDVINIPLWLTNTVFTSTVTAINTSTKVVTLANTLTVNVPNNEVVCFYRFA